MKLPLAVLAGAVALVTSSTSHALSFSLTFTPGTTVQQQQAFVEAGARWSALFSDNVTLDMTVGVEALSVGVLTSAGSRRASYS